MGTWYGPIWQPQRPMHPQNSLRGQVWLQIWNQRPQLYTFISRNMTLRDKEAANKIHWLTLHANNNSFLEPPILIQIILQSLPSSGPRLILNLSACAVTVPTTRWTLSDDSIFQQASHPTCSRSGSRCGQTHPRWTANNSSQHIMKTLSK